MVTLDHTARTRIRVPTKPFFLLLHRRLYRAASGHTERL
jgi:hypothetical protein